MQSAYAVTPTRSAAGHTLQPSLPAASSSTFLLSPYLPLNKCSRPSVALSFQYIIFCLAIRRLLSLCCVSLRGPGNPVTRPTRTQVNTHVGLLHTAFDRRVTFSRHQRSARKCRAAWRLALTFLTFRPLAYNTRGWGILEAWWRSYTHVYGRGATGTTV